MLVRMDEILKEAQKGNYAVPAPNVWNLETVYEAIHIAEEEKSPIILDYGEDTSVFYFDEIAMLAKYYASKTNIPVALNLDHGSSFETAISAIRAGFTSVMVDRSSLPFEDNLAQTKEICKIAHAANVSVESELGHVGIGSEYNSDDVQGLTDPSKALEFVQKSECDCLAVAIGTSHGTYKGKPNLHFDLLETIRKTVDVPLVLHGGSGTGDDNLVRAIKGGICKINLYTDLSNAGMDCFDKVYTNPETRSIDRTMVTLHEKPIEAYGEKLRYYCRLFGSSHKI